MLGKAWSGWLVAALVALGGAAGAQEDEVAGEVQGEGTLELTLDAGAPYATYAIEVAEGAEALLVTATGGPGAIDLYLRHGEPMATWDEADHAASSVRRQEALWVDGTAIPGLRAGRYYLDVTLERSDTETARAVITIRSGKLAAIDAGLARAIEAAPAAPRPLLERAMCRLERDDPRGALEDLDRALGLAADDAALHCQRAYAQHRAGERAAAAASFARAVALDPSYGGELVQDVGGAGTVPVQLSREAPWRTLRVAVPAGAKRLRIVTRGVSGKVALYARHGLPIYHWGSDPDVASEGEGSDVQVEVQQGGHPELLPGAYYVDVVGESRPFQVDVELE